MKAPNERTETGNLLVTLRKARGFTSGKAAAAHVREQTGVVGLADSVWASYESGTRKVSEKHREAIESVLGRMPEPVTASGAGQSADIAGLVAIVQTLVVEIAQEREEWRQEREEWRQERRELLDAIKRLLPPGQGATQPVPADPFEDSPLTTAGRDAAELAHREMGPEAVADPAAAPLLRTVPRTRPARRQP